jgi:glycosyltransferase involved in cell wall biosynthesis
MSDPSPAVSVLVCTYNRAELLGRTLTALLDQQVQRQDEVLVVDNNSKDATAAVVAGFQPRFQAQGLNLRYEREPKQGLSAARNRAVSTSTRPLVAFLDDDALPVPGWMAALRQSASEHPLHAGFGGPVHPDFAIEPPGWIRQPHLLSLLSVAEPDWPDGDYPGRRSPIGANMAFPRALLGAEPFDVRLGRCGASLVSGEENALFRRLRDRGRFRFVRAMAVRHHIPEERMTHAWFLARFRAEGETAALAAPSTWAAFRVLTRHLRKLAYLRLSPGSGAMFEEAAARSAISASWRRLRAPKSA